MYLVCAFAAVLLSFAVDKVMMDHYIQLTEVAGPLTDQAYELKLIRCTVHAVTRKYANVKYCTCTCTYNYQNNALTSRVTNIHVHAQTYINVLTNNSLKLTYFNFKFIFMILFN